MESKMYKLLIPMICVLACLAACKSAEPEAPISSEITQESQNQEKCHEIAIRIACNTTNSCKKGMSDADLEKRLNAEMMIAHLCIKGPDDFHESWWIDMDGKYQPYYTDSAGNKSKIPF